MNPTLWNPVQGLRCAEGLRWRAFFWFTQHTIWFTHRLHIVPMNVQRQWFCQWIVLDSTFLLGLMLWNTICHKALVHSQYAQTLKWPYLSNQLSVWNEPKNTLITVCNWQIVLYFKVYSLFAVVWLSLRHIKKKKISTHLNIFYEGKACHRVVEIKFIWQSLGFRGSTATERSRDTTDPMREIHLHACE